MSTIRFAAVELESLSFEIEWSRLPLVIGRSAEADIRVNDRWASRRHCELDQVDGALIVRDVGSRNGTLVNRVAVPQAPLYPGDSLTVGLSTFEVSYEFIASDDARLVASESATARDHGSDSVTVKEIVLW